MQDRRRPQRGRIEPDHEPVRKPTAAELANLHKLAVEWRNEWRAKTSCRDMEPARTVRVAQQPRRRKPVPPTRGDAAFATAIARAEFGRFYWNEALDGRLKAAMERSRDGKKS
jgi:hypothetical protein